MKKIQVKDVLTQEVLKKQQEWWNNKNLPFTYERFKGVPEKVVFRKMEKLVEQGYLEYGTSLRTAWLTDKGKKLIKKKEKCNENWHVFNNGSDKPCQCGKTDSWDNFVKRMEF